MASEAVIPITTDIDVVAARQKGRELATVLGFVSTDSTLLATAISELARNIIRYARYGEILISSVQSGERVGITVVARDKGPGIANISLAMQDGFSTSGGLGLGLPGVKRMMDEFHLVSDANRTSTACLWQWSTGWGMANRRLRQPILLSPH
ncbi:MAG: anti-sigma regulatory factor [Nitrospirae bacterium]|nr:MAG: anti-sigma regulatory factor [Nitrospirota bacterium]